VTVKDEMRRNLLATMRRKEPLFPGIVGYEETVIPQIVQAILSRHDFILLGLRGQAKTRLIRGLVRFLDESIPAIEGCPINDSPFDPGCAPCQRLLKEKGDAVPIRWIGREERYREKLATPDVTMADLIGDIDPIKAASLRLDLSREEVIHYGIVPRTNRGVFAINELPDLQPRIQVGLLNILEERDLQIRGFPVRIPMDILLVFSANPEDYTNRGNIITPLRDRIDSQIITHYPLKLEDGIAITRQEAWQERAGDVEVRVPDWMREAVESIAVRARASEFVDQTSGVSARLPITAIENLISAAERRGLLLGERQAWTRPCDLQSALPAVTGKIELVYEGEQEGPLRVGKRLIGEALRETFLRYFPDAYREGGGGKEAGSGPYRGLVEWFAKGNRVEVSDAMSASEHFRALDQVPGLRGLVSQHLRADRPEEQGPAMELVLEGLSWSSILSRDELGRGATYGDLLKDMLKGMEGGGGRQRRRRRDTEREEEEEP
jgi:magnesium chelatase subunit I